MGKLTAYRACFVLGLVFFFASTATGLGYAPGAFANLDELLGVTAVLAERGGIYTSHARSYVDPPRPADDPVLPMNIQALDETAAVHRAHGVPVQHSHLIFVGDSTWATTDRALEHFERAIELTPDAPIAHIEYGNGLYLMFGDKQLDKVTDLYIKASEMTPKDAMEKLDVESALSELE